MKVIAVVCAGLVLSGLIWGFFSHGFLALAVIGIAGCAFFSHYAD